MLTNFLLPLKKYAPLYALLLSLMGSSDVFAQQIDFSGNSNSAIKISPPKETGLDQIYVLPNLNDVALLYTTDNPNEVQVSSFKNKGAAFATSIDNLIIDKNRLKIDNLNSDTGYIIEDNNKTWYIWIIDYSKYRFQIESVNASSEINCESTVVDFFGQAEAINYYTINGRQETISREINIIYRSLEFNEEFLQFEEKEYEKNIAYITEKISLTPPLLCPTDIIIKGDRFLKEWGETLTYESDNFTPVATSVRTEVIQNNNSEESSNIISSNNESFGGSAPADISFRAYVSDAVVHCEWQMANDEDFNDITYRINQQDFDYTFTNEGTTYVRFIGSNYDGSCESYGDIYTINIGNSELYIPNAFSPNGDGINDEWKVSYRSIIEFKCWIFDVNGHEIFSFNNPSEGWDGRYKGRLVKPGVYYYIIQATGADGKKYKRSGDINILKSYGKNSNSGDI